MKKIILDEIIGKHCNITLVGGENPFSNTEFVDKSGVSKAMIEFGNLLLELVTEKVELKIKNRIECQNEELESSFVSGSIAIIVDKQSILDTINQVELTNYNNL